MERREHTLASGCDIPRRCKHNTGQTGSTEPEHHQEVEPEHIENDRTDETGAFDEEETICDQPSSDTVSGRNTVFLINTDYSVERMGTFMRLSCSIL